MTIVAIHIIPHTVTPPHTTHPHTSHTLTHHTPSHLTRTGCPVNTQEFVSFNRNLLPLSNVRATSEDTGFNHAEDLVKYSSQDNPPWCSEADITMVTDHHIELNFTEPVVLTLMESSGYYDGYVNSFAIEYGPLDGELSTYTVNGETQVRDRVYTV